MSDRVYKSVEITGTSEQGVDDAIRGAIGKATQSLRHVDWFEVTQIRGAVLEDQISYYQVTMKVGFRLE
jgi:flavin-binding protein dodecin